MEAYATAYMCLQSQDLHVQYYADESVEMHVCEEWHSIGFVGS